LVQQVLPEVVTTSQALVGAVGDEQAAATRTAAETRRAIERRIVI
jgi:hypothetical protein